jgi:hypothetical protein
MLNCYKGVALSFGYVESNTTSWLIFTIESGECPTSRKEALHTLTEYLYNKYKAEKDDNAKFSDNYKSHMAKCCRDAWSKRNYQNPPTNCPRCNASYDVPCDRTFSVEDWEDWLKRLQSSDCDSYGDHDYIECKYDWTPWRTRFDIPQHQMVIVCENAEHILTMALAEIHPELGEEVEDDDYGLFERDNSESDPYYASDYDNICDETCSFNDYGYHKPGTQNELVMVEEGVAQLRPAIKRMTETITRDFPDGSSYTMVDGYYTHIKYSIGDQIWVQYVNSKYEVYRVQTHDGLTFEYPIETAS